MQDPSGVALVKQRELSSLAGKQEVERAKSQEGAGRGAPVGPEDSTKTIRDTFHRTRLPRAESSLALETSRDEALLMIPGNHSMPWGGRELQRSPSSKPLPLMER